MANKHKGEASFEAGGKTYTLAVTLNAMAEVEDYFLREYGIDATFESLTKGVEQGKVRYVRAFLWALLQRDHPEVVLKADSTAQKPQVDVSALIEKAGGVEHVGKILEAVAKASEPDEKDVQALGTEGRGSANPPRAGRGTSETSTSTPGA